jgi:hypothetical protein
MRSATYSLLLVVSLCAVAAGAHAATLTITSDKSTYQVGESITLTVLGDSGGVPDLAINGRLLFEPELAEHVSASQSQLTSFGSILWIRTALSHGEGFADAFDQTVGTTPFTVDQALTSIVVLRAIAPGELNFDWAVDFGVDSLGFFGLTNAPGGSVTIVPEPSTGWLLALGLAALCSQRA